LFSWFLYALQGIGDQLLTAQVNRDKLLTAQVTRDQLLTSQVTRG
jgi:hypothetical protein